MNERTTLVLVPCLSGAPWDLETLTPLHDWPLRTFALPDDVDDVERYADHVAHQVRGLGRYVLVGDSFGALVSLALAARRPRGLAGLVLSGGFASPPIVDPWLRLKVRAAGLLPGPLYRHLTLRMHAAALSSRHDAEGEVPWTDRDSRALFLEHTPWRSYVGRTRASLRAQYADALPRIDVPTLILTPEDDRLVGPEAARALLEGIPDATETVLPRTGHMFRFSHPRTYAREVASFAIERVADEGPRRVAAAS